MGGSAEAEPLFFERLARELMQVQDKNKVSSGAADIARTFHAKAVLGVENARLKIRDDVPPALQTGFVRPGVEYPVTVRLSNASGTRQADVSPDMRGAALRVEADDGTHDLLMTSFPVSHARNAREFVEFAKAMAGAESTVQKVIAFVVKLPLAVGPSTALRMFRNVRAATRRTVRSLALATYWSRGAILWGDEGPVRYQLRSAEGTPDVYAGPTPSPADPDYLRRELAQRLGSGDVVFDLCVQRYVDANRTPIEDGSVEWTEDVAPAIPVATLTISRQDIDTAEAHSAARRIEQLTFNPWHTTEEFRPLGNLNRARKVAYEAGSAHRLGYRFTTEEPRRNTILSAVVSPGFSILNRFVPWYRLPLPLSLLNLAFLRKTLRKLNLIDTEIREASPRAEPVPAPIEEQFRVARSYDGTFNDLSASKMGAVGATFGLHDWVDHRRYPVGTRSVNVPLPPGVTWHNTPEGPAEPVMRFAELRSLVPRSASAFAPWRPILPVQHGAGVGIFNSAVTSRGEDEDEEGVRP